MNEETKTKEEVKIQVIDDFNWQIPECCKEGWDSCKHVIQKQIKVRTNIGI